MRKTVLLFLCFIGISAFAQTEPDEDTSTETETSSGIFHNPIRRGIDVGMMGLGALLWTSAGRVPQTETVLAAEAKVHDLHVQLSRESPEYTEAKNNLDKVRQIRTIESEELHHRKLEQFLEDADRIQGYLGGRKDEQMILPPSTLSQLRQTEIAIRADIRIDKERLITQRKKDALLDQARKAVKDAEKNESLYQLEIQNQLKAAKVYLDGAKDLAIKENVRAPWIRKGFGIVFFLGGLSDLVMAWRDNEANAHLATPEETAEYVAILVKEGIHPVIQHAAAR